MAESNNITFFCRECNLERDYNAVKYWHGKEPYWAAKCVCGRKLVRYIVNKHLDPYYQISPSLRKYKAENWRDLVQPGDKDFKTLYTKTANEMEEAQEKAELKAKEEKVARDKILKEIPKDYRLRETVAKLYE